jgi:hypothetical protein
MGTPMTKKKRASFDAALLWLSEVGEYEPRDVEKLRRSEAVQMLAWLYEMNPNEVALCYWRVFTMTDLKKQRAPQANLWAIDSRSEAAAGCGCG